MLSCRNSLSTLVQIYPKVLPDCLVIFRYLSHTICRKTSSLTNEAAQGGSSKFHKSILHRSWQVRLKSGDGGKSSGPYSWKQQRSHYASLEITPTSSTKEIKDAFIRLSKQYHPDLQPESQTEKATEIFQRVVEAYEVLGDPVRKKEYDASLGLSRKLPFNRSTISSNAHEYDEAGYKTRGPMYGVDPEFGRTIDVDLSEDRMRKAWDAYKIRWESEEENRRILEEKKLEFRILLDKKREMYEVLTPEEKASFKESIRLFRHPSFVKKSGEFYQTNEPQNDNDPYNSYTEAFKKHIKENYNISLFDGDIRMRSDKNENIAEKSFLDKKNDEKETTTNSFSNKISQGDTTQIPNRRMSFGQDSLSKNNVKKVKRILESDTSSQHRSTEHEDVSLADKRTNNIQSQHGRKLEYNEVGSSKLTGDEADLLKEAQRILESDTSSQHRSTKYEDVSMGENYSITSAYSQRGRKLKYNEAGSSKPTGDEVDDIVKAIHTPNPTTEYFVRSGTGVHQEEEEFQEEVKNILKTQKGFKGAQILHHREGELHPSMSEDVKASGFAPEHDPFMVDKRNISDSDTSYFKQWQQNIDERSAIVDKKKASNEKSVMTRIFVVFACLLMLTVGVSKGKGLVNNDIPVNSKSNDSSSTSKNSSVK